MSTALYNLPVVCRDDEYTTFTTPNGQTCAQWAGDYATLVGGYLANPDATGTCNFCEYCYMVANAATLILGIIGQYASGNTFLAGVNINFSDRGRDLGIFVCYVVFNCMVTLMAARFLN